MKFIKVTPKVMHSHLKMTPQQNDAPPPPQVVIDQPLTISGMQVCS